MRKCVTVFATLFDYKCILGRTFLFCDYFNSEFKKLPYPNHLAFDVMMETCVLYTYYSNELNLLE